MQWFTNAELSGADLELLRGSDVMINMLHNKLVIVVDKPPAGPAMFPTEQIGLLECEGFWHIREVAKSTTAFEILFELKTDCEKVQEHLTLYKLSQD
tara:strand:+ start:3541 stop:3831 length:291 start_codon:yes stop_codon:yes gene_type:complete